MPTIKKPSKRQVVRKAETDKQKVLNALNTGAKLELTKCHNGIEYGVKYLEGGYFRISKRLYDYFINQ